MLRKPIVTQYCIFVSSGYIMSSSTGRSHANAQFLSQMASFSGKWAITILFCSIVLSRAIVVLIRQSSRRRKMPPGPSGLPFLGNVLQIPRFQWLRFTEWKEQYGESLIDETPTRLYTRNPTYVSIGTIFSLDLGGQPVIVVNDFTTASDLLGK